MASDVEGAHSLRATEYIELLVDLGLHTDDALDLELTEDDIRRHRSRREV